jgi:hypothetical protein
LSILYHVSLEIYKWIYVFSEFNIKVISSAIIEISKLPVPLRSRERCKDHLRNTRTSFDNKWKGIPMLSKFYIGPTGR